MRPRVSMDGTAARSGRQWACLLLAVPILAAPVLTVAESLNLREEMGPALFEEAGLERLSPEELTALTSWIQTYMSERAESDDTLAVPRGERSFGLEQVTEAVAALFERESPEAMESRIQGEFRGWSGNTIFHLENGQVWRQSGPGRFAVRLDNPKVTIRRAALGSYLLSVEGYRSSVRVRRVR